MSASHTDAYPTYSQNGSATNCRSCHGNFRASSYTSLADGQNWGNLHNLHRNIMVSRDCSTCHGSPFSAVALGSSNGGTGLAAIGCMGCHGRDEDMGNDSTSPGRGAGLRQHHYNAGETVCANCHSDANPANYTPVGENVLPPYYFTPDAAHPNKSVDSCSPNGEEDYAGLLRGLDNDGDGVYDTNDSDCMLVVCGNGILEAGEQCDDGNNLGGDCCSAICQFEAAGSPCPDGLLCNGQEACDGAGTCQPGLPVDCNDGSACTIDSCDAVTGLCNNIPISCDDGSACTIDSCDPVTGCANVPVNCDDSSACTIDSCDAVTGLCNNIPISCDDGSACTIDSCDPVTGCANVPVNCDDSNACTIDSCDPITGCGNAPVNCSDGIACTDDSCDPVTGLCSSVANDANCPDDTLFCNGTEFCDSLNDCSSTGDPCPAGTVCNDTTDTCSTCGDGFLNAGEECDDGNVMDGDCCSAICTLEPAGSSCADGVFCNGLETCDGAGVCQSGMPADCNDGIACTIDQCDVATDACVNTPDNAFCDDGLFCTGIEMCDVVNDCQLGTPVDCNDGIGCTDDVCDEASGTCVNTANDANCPDDALFCNGTEFCDALNDCSSTGDPCLVGTTCDETTDTCIAGNGNGDDDSGDSDSDDDDDDDHHDHDHDHDHDGGDEH